MSDVRLLPHGAKKGSNSDEDNNQGDSLCGDLLTTTPPWLDAAIEAADIINN